MLQEAFISQKSLIHGLTPRTKILAAIISSTVIALSNELPVLGLALGAALLLVIGARLDFRQTGRRLLVLSGFPPDDLADPAVHLPGRNCLAHLLSQRQS